jgi:hypothetical protein
MRFKSWLVLSKILLAEYMATRTIVRVNGISGMEGMKVTMYFVVLTCFWCCIDR